MADWGHGGLGYEGALSPVADKLVTRPESCLSWISLRHLGVARPVTL